MNIGFAVSLVSVVLVACAGAASPTDSAANGAAAAPEPAPQVRPAAPTAPRVTLVGGTNFGARTARIALVVYADYQCPYCAGFHHGMLGELKSRYIDTGVLLYAHRDFPLDVHPQAMPAAIVARCAGVQGRYGAMQGRLYEAHDRLDESLYTQLAKTIGLNLAAFARCRNDVDVRRAVERDLGEGERLGVTGTPTLILGRIEGNGVVVERVAAGVPTLEMLIQEIERLRVATK